LNLGPSTSLAGGAPAGPKFELRRWVGADRLPSGWRPAAIGLALALAVVAAFWPALGCDFVNYDDPDYVTANPQVQSGLTGQGVLWAFRSGHASNWHPLTWLSHMLDCQLFGIKSAGHHLTSVLLHVVNTGLLFVVLRRLTGATWRSAFVAALFGLHPLRVESVAWISERKDVLSALFWILTVGTYARFVGEAKVQGPKSKVFYGSGRAFSLG